MHRLFAQAYFYSEIQYISDSFVAQPFSEHFNGFNFKVPSLSTNYFGMSKDMEKRLPQLYYIKMKISYDLGFIAIRVTMATSLKGVCTFHNCLHYGKV